MHSPPRVLCLLASGFQELELIAPVDLLRRAGVEVAMASITDSIHVTGRNGVMLALVERLCGAAKAGEVARSIMA